MGYMEFDPPDPQYGQAADLGERCQGMTPFVLNIWAVHRPQGLPETYWPASDQQLPPVPS